MESISLADMFWMALVLAGVIAEILERRARRRTVQGGDHAGQPTGHAPVTASAHRA